MEKNQKFEMKLSCKNHGKKTRKQLLFLKKNISLINQLYMNVNTLRIVYTAVLTLAAKNDPNFSILLSKKKQFFFWGGGVNTIHGPIAVHLCQTGN